ncbi:MAG TPA: glycosyltransferase family 39 protein [Candidatus Polarisedimenticolaceae bacterium]|nr:glycosyltransferase family 39 protein [Candidatus Polarisedimenticolaceae bacterium]
MDAARRLAGPVALAALAVLYLHTLGRPSLWFDEAWEANSYAGYVDAPWYNRPVLYMGVEKAVVHACGPSEFALRLLPCLAGLAAVAVTFVLVRREAGAASAWAAAALLALAPPFLFHAHELKNYSLDALFAVLLVLLWTQWRASRTWGRLLTFAAVAALSFGFSFTAVFVIAVCAAGEAWAERRTPRRLLPFGAAVAALAAVFAVTYFRFHADAVATGGLQDQFPGAFPPASMRALAHWLLHSTLDLLRALTGNVSSIAAGACTAAGLLLQARRRGGALAFVLPGLFLVHVAAAMVHVYPYGVERVSLDLAPFACAASAVALTALVPTGGTARAGGLLALAGAVWVLYQPSIKGIRPYLTTGWRQEHIRPLVDTLDRRRNGEEKIYVSDCGPAFTFYWRRHGHPADDPALIWGERHRYRPEDHRREVEAIAAREARLWTLFSHVPPQEMAAVRRLFAEHYTTLETYGEGDVGLDRLVRRQER